MRTIFWCFNSINGYRISRLRLTAEEAAARADITTVQPPDETADERAWFDPETNTWSLVPR
jgi:hypothetical protein